ncbi:hypothetical protein [Actinomadura hibisca]|uniref:hypothetical protein n=1 Tax=Actinomadura hibisca TaxID=68565 RepID=UPI000AC1E7B9|nr:hypothetical protein [Actinomadura hibisca]
MEGQRKVLISDDVAALLGEAKVAELLAGPEPGRYECVICDRPGDADVEATSVLLYRYPEARRPGHHVLNILWAHVGCAPSQVHDRDTEIDPDRYFRRQHLIPLLFGSDTDAPTAALVMEPWWPGLEEAGAQTNAYLAAWLAEGLHLLGVGDLMDVPAAGRWRAVFVPGDREGGIRTTVTCRADDRRALTVVDDYGIRVDRSWLDSAAAEGIVLYAGLTGLIETPGRDPETIVRALVAAAHGGVLAGGRITAAILGLPESS